jgi:SAM-dependent methyltransferase
LPPSPDLHESDGGMNHDDHVNLLRGGVPAQGGLWADFGSGGGAFTLALADLIGASGEIYSVDRDANALAQQKREMTARFPKVTVHYLHHDFTRPLELPPLDGIVMANSLHFHRDKDSILQRMLEYLKPGGHFVLIEYNTDSGNQWVPYPLSFATWQAQAEKHGFTETTLLYNRESRFLDAIYSALSRKP